MATLQERKLKVTTSYRNNKALPELRICGVWLQQLGFNIGDMVSITASENSLIIQPLKTETNGNK